MSQVEPPLEDAMERLERMAASQGFSVEEELAGLDEVDGATTRFKSYEEMLNAARAGALDSVDERAIEQMRRMWGAPPYNNPQIEMAPGQPRFVPDEDLPP